LERTRGGDEAGYGIDVVARFNDLPVSHTKTNSQPTLRGLLGVPPVGELADDDLRVGPLMYE
jgi:hypothetical protein